jgi:thymidylate synthase
MGKILEKGLPQGNTISLFGESLEFDLHKDGFPLVSSRKINYKAAFGELACFLKGTTDNRNFIKNGVNFWTADCNKTSWVYSEYKRHDHDLGLLYGYQWRYGFKMDQLHELVVNIRKNPESRRHVLITYNPGDIKRSSLPPCYVSHQFYVREGKYLDMMVHQRSADYQIGVPFDIASFALFQELMAKQTFYKAGKLKINFGDVHIYNAHIEQARKHLKITPNMSRVFLDISERSDLFDFKPEDASINNYYPEAPIKYEFIVQAK